MIRIFSGRSLFDSQCDYLSNTINTVGAMGAGLALEFRLRIPEMYRLYKEKCDRGEIKIGKYWIYDKPNRLGKKILNFPVKKVFNHPSKWEYIIEGLEYFTRNHDKDNIASIAMPTLGARLGKLDDEAVLIMMQESLKHLPISIEIYRNYAQDRLTKWVKEQVNKMTVSEISKQLQVPVFEAERITTRLRNSFLLSDLVVFDKMSVNLVQKVYDFAYRDMSNQKLPRFIEAHV